MKNKTIIQHISVIFLLAAILACNSLNKIPDPQIPAETPNTKIYAISISAGGTHACAVLNNGKVACWGSNSEGQLGDGTYTQHTSAIVVPNLAEVTTVSSGGGFTCALTKTGAVKCWGENTANQIADGTKTVRKTPVDINGLETGVVAITTGSEHACVLLENGSVKCWGKNLYGRTGTELTTRLVPEPTDVAGLTSGVKMISAGYEHTCAINKSNILQCWGSNSSGELGIGSDSKKMSFEPIDVINLTGTIFISAGFKKSCAVINTGAVKCWGWSGLNEFSSSPTDIIGAAKDIISVTSGTMHSCALTNNGAVKCWGTNEKGELGNSRFKESYRAVDVEGLPAAAIAISANNSYVCALLSNGEVWCWGGNSSGQLGNGTTEDSVVPVKVIGITE